MKARITRLLNDIDLPAYHTEESAGFDLAAGQDAVIPAGQTEKVRTGLIIQAPPGFFLMVAARSSLARKKGLKLANGIGVVDRDFAGPADEIFLLLHNFTSEAVEIKKGERLAQGIFVPFAAAEWEEGLPGATDSRGGFGHTGGYAN